jgi:pyrrolidone-carboxylate peptidase
MSDSNTSNNVIKPKILVYGFEPWGDTDFNVSGELILRGLVQKDLVSLGHGLANFEFKVLPVNRYALSDYLIKNNKTYSGYIGLGSSNKAKRVTIEKWFTNDYDGSPVLNSVAQGSKVPSNIVPEFGEYLNFGDSNSCGTFVCNASALLGFEFANGQSGFVHIPKQEDESDLAALSVSVARSIKAMKFSEISFGLIQALLAPAVQASRSAEKPFESL